VDKINKEVNQALSDPTVRAKFSELGAEPMIGPPEDLNNLMAADIKKWTAIIKKGGIILEK
jgi:tripartite-type tricarboxylate transporter receptor subunit TctC